MATTETPAAAPTGVHPPALPARAIVLGYLVVAVLWIALSDLAVGLLVPDPLRTPVETVKGWAFVAITATTLAILLRRYEADREERAAALTAGERRFRLLAEHAQDIIFRFGIASQAFEYISPAVERVLDYPAAAFMQDPELFFRLAHPDDRGQLDYQNGSWRDERPMLLRVRNAEGRWVWLEQRSSLILDDAGRPVALEGVARDVTEQRRVEEALARVNRVQRTLGAVNQALVRATDEPPLLEAICRAVVEEGGFRFAWVGYCEDDEAGTVRPVAHAGHEDGYLASIMVTWRDGPHGRGPTGTAAREGRTAISRDIGTDRCMVPWAGAAQTRGYASSAGFPLRQGDAVFGILSIYAREPDAFGPEEVALLEELAADLSYGVAALRNRAAGAAAEAARRRLSTAIEQSPDSVVITDATGAIEYVNPAFERATGYSAAEALGRNPRLLKSGHQSPAFYEALWRTLDEGRPWVGDFVNRRKDGSLFTEEAVISPVHDATGATAGYVAVKRDVTAEREAQARERTRARERALVAQALAGLHPQATPEETAQAVCRQIVQLPEASIALLLVFEPDGGAVSLAAASADGRVVRHRRLAEGRARHLRERAGEGPWVEHWRQARGPLSRTFRAVGVQALAYAPIRIDEAVVGLLEVGAVGVDAAERLTERLPALVEFASIANAVLGPSIASRAQRNRSHERIRRIIDRRAFRPVFQPIVDLSRLAVVGYEALTRFEDGTPPDGQFREAAALGLGVELECAALESALAAATALPAAPWLNVNVSPAAILAGEPLRSIVARFPGRLVLEVTEHEVITDYEAFRDAVAALGPEVRIAVDDAGAGFASLRHIVELRPHIVKIDRTLVAGIDADPARQALLTGLRHFADSQGCSLVAEGIETEGELAALVALGVPSGQGYLLGQPVPVLAAGTAMARAVGAARDPMDLADGADDAGGERPARRLRAV